MSLAGIRWDSWEWARCAPPACPSEPVPQPLPPTVPVMTCGRNYQPCDEFSFVARERIRESSDEVDLVGITGPAQGSLAPPRKRVVEPLLKDVAEQARLAVRCQGECGGKRCRQVVRILSSHPTHWLPVDLDHESHDLGPVVRVLQAVAGGVPRTAGDVVEHASEGLSEATGEEFRWSPIPLITGLRVNITDVVFEYRVVAEVCCQCP